MVRWPSGGKVAHIGEADSGRAAGEQQLLRMIHHMLRFACYCWLGFRRTLHTDPFGLELSVNHSHVCVVGEVSGLTHGAHVFILFIFL